MSETWAQKVERLKREIAERQAELAQLVLGDPAESSEVQPGWPPQFLLAGSPVSIKTTSGK